VVVACFLQGCKQNSLAENNGGTDDTDSIGMVDDDPTADETDELISEEPMPKAAEEFFDDFFFNFASNKRLQKERICFPLLVRSNAKTDTLQSKDWHTDHFFMHQEEYTLIFDNEEQMNQAKEVPVEEVTVEKIFLSQAFVNQYVFRKKNGQWKLDEIRKQTLSLNPNASFLAFYRRFASDSIFQHQSLNEEIQFVGPDPDDEFSQMEGVITPDFWEAFAPELPRDTIYNIIYGKRKTSADDKIFVIRGISNGQEVMLTFHHQHDKWKLTKLSE
jgi:hypothetical protein